MIFALLNQKGGVGKTTLSIHLADALARRGERTLLVDADPQQSAMTWSGVGTPRFPVIGMPKANLHTDVFKLAEDYDHVVIDGPPRVTDLARSIIMAADLVIIPVTPSQFDVWAASATVDLIKEAQIYKPQIKAVFAINRKVVNTAIGREVRSAISDLGLPILDADLSQRVGFVDAITAGGTIADFDPKGRGAREIETWVTELTRTHEQKTKPKRTTGRAARA